MALAPIEPHREREADTGDQRALVVYKAPLLPCITSEESPMTAPAGDSHPMVLCHQQLRNARTSADHSPQYGHACTPVLRLHLCVHVPYCKAHPEKTLSLELCLAEMLQGLHGCKPVSHICRRKMGTEAAQIPLFCCRKDSSGATAIPGQASHNLTGLHALPGHSPALWGPCHPSSEAAASDLPRCFPCTCVSPTIFPQPGPAGTTLF